MRIDRDGVWHHEGRPIARKPLVKLFASVLRREKDGSHWLVTPVEKGRIEVEDAPFVIVDLAIEGESTGRTIRVCTNLDEWFTIDQDHPLRLRPERGRPDDGPLPYVDVRNGLEARLLRPVYYDLAEFVESAAQDGVQRLGIWSAGAFFALE